ncbi:MAG: redox-regulated ATPase YchF [Patescibacteria group bacterium]|nr:redox-regulated ATPase YchF [Patescibacteria group bacterium]
MANISCGIVGLPNVGKSTLFNALLKRQVAEAENYPFCTIEPNVGVVEVPDERLGVLARLENSAKVIPAAIKFVDIAGLVKDAHKGEGLGNQFLAHIREVDAIVHVVRAFENDDVVRSGSIDPKSDNEIIETELALADLQTVEKRIGGESKAARTDKNAEKRLIILSKLSEALSQGKSAREIVISDEDKELIKDLNLLTMKPEIKVYNVAEDELSKENFPDGIVVSAKVESELCSFDEEEAKQYLSELGVKESGLERLIKRCYETLGLVTFFTAGPKEARAWTTFTGSKAPQAAGVIHTDFEKGFIRAEVVTYEKMVEVGSFDKAREKGWVRLEGREYSIQDGDVVYFRFNI